MLLIYTGNGKGKTSSCVGQCIRAIGQGLEVFFVQLMKSNTGAGEQKFLQSILSEKMYIGGLGFFLKEEDREKHREAVLTSLKYIHENIDKAEMFIIDECLYALKSGLITKEEVLEIIEKCKDKHLVLSGRNLPDWLEEKADIVSEIQEIKHCCKKGVPATKGIEF